MIKIETRKHHNVYDNYIRSHNYTHFLHLLLLVDLAGAFWFFGNFQHITARVGHTINISFCMITDIITDHASWHHGLGIMHFIAVTFARSRSRKNMLCNPGKDRHTVSKLLTLLDFQSRYPQLSRRFVTG